MRYVIINEATGSVVNVVEWDGSAQWSPPRGTIAIQSGEGGIGDAWDGKAFTSPPQAQPEPSAIEALVETLVSKGVLSAEDKDGVLSKR